MSQPTKTKCTSEAQASAKKPAKSETASGPPAEATPAARGGAASAVTGQASLGAAKGKQQGIKPQIKEHLQSAAASPPCTDSSKGEPAESVSAGATAAKTADSEGKTKETKSKDMSKNVPISSNKEKSAKPVVTTIAAKSPEATVTRQKSKQKSLPQAPKVSKKEESKKAAVPLAPPAEKKAKGAEGSSPQPPVEKKNKKNEDNAMSLDALSALENLLPAAEPAPEPPKVQPKDIVQEDKLKSEKGVRVGEREDTLPPDYRFTEDKMKDLPRPQKEPSMDSGEALDILSGDFSSSAVAPAATASAAPSKQPNSDVVAIDALAGDFVVPQKTSSVQAPVRPSSQTQQQENSMSLDALSALENLLPAAEPAPEPPKVQPKDVVQEDKLKSEKGVRVGEREDTLPPDYRFTEDKMKDFPPPQKEPSMDSGEALDILSGDFSSSAVAPAAAAPAAPSKQSNQEVVAIDALAGDFVTSQKASSVQAPICPSSQSQQQDNAMSLDALSALENLLPAAEPAPEPPKVQPKDIVQEDKLKSEKGVRVGEREDTLPPDYRFTEDKMKDLPRPQKEPSMDSGEALDILSGDFSSSAVAPAATASAAPSKQSSPDISTDALKGDFVAPQKASSVQASIIPSCQTQQQVGGATMDNSMSLDALNTLGDMLPAAEPVAKPPEIQPKDIVQGDKLKSKKAVRVGEREDTLPPDYRFKDDKQSDHPVPQKEPSMDTTEALDLLSGDFSSTAAASAPVAAPKPIQTKGQVMDALSNTLVPDAPVFKPKTATAEEAKVPSTKLKSQSEKQTEAGTSEKLTKHSGTDVAVKTPTKKSSKS